MLGVGDLEALAETPALFRTRSVSRLQGIINEFLTRLENDGHKIPTNFLTLQVGILLTKHNELSAIAPPASVHNQTTIINGLSQDSARTILAGRTRTRSSAGPALVAVAGPALVTATGPGLGVHPSESR